MPTPAQMLTRVGKLAETNGNAKPIFSEIARGFAQPYYGYSIQAYDPGLLQYHDKHPILRRKGFKLVDEMLDDPQINACLNVLICGAMARGWSVQPAEQGDKQREAEARFVRVVIEQMRGTVEKAIRKVLTALPYGYSITEKNFVLIDRGEFKGKVGLASIKGKKPGLWDFDLDEFDNITALRSLVGAGREAQVLDPGKFLIYTWDSDFENPYGKSILARVYKPWWAKTNIQKFFMIYLDKFGMPTVKTSVPVGTDEAVKEELKKLIKYIQSDTGIIIPDNVQMELMNVAAQSGNSSYTQGLDWFDAQIAKGILGAELAINANRGTGSYAQAQVHAETMGSILDYLRQEIEESVMAEQVVRQLVDYNYEVDQYPCWKLNPLRDDDVEMLSRTYKTLLDGGIIDKNEPWIRQKFGFPELDPEIRKKREEEAAAMTAQMQANPGADNDQGGSDEDEDGQPARFAELEGISSLILTDGWLTDYRHADGGG